MKGDKTWPHKPAPRARFAFDQFLGSTCGQQVVTDRTGALTLFLLSLAMLDILWRESAASAASMAFSCLVVAQVQEHDLTLLRH